MGLKRNGLLMLILVPPSGLDMSGYVWFSEEKWVANVDSRLNGSTESRFKIFLNNCFFYKFLVLLGCRSSSIC